MSFNAGTLSATDLKAAMDKVAEAGATSETFAQAIRSLGGFFGVPRSNSYRVIAHPGFKTAKRILKFKRHRGKKKRQTVVVVRYGMETAVA